MSKWGNSGQPLPVVIVGPSLEVAQNVSGIASVIKALETALRGRVAFSHVRMGRIDGDTRGALARLGDIFRSFGRLVACREKIVHYNTALNVKSLLRDSVGIVLAWITRRRVLLHLHGGRYLEESAPTGLAQLIRLLSRLSDRTVLLSATERENFTRLYGVPSAGLDYLYNGIEQPRSLVIRPADGRPLKVLFCGRLAEEKGIVPLVAAFDNIPADVAELTVFGAGPFAPLIESKPNIRFTGIIERAALLERLGSFDVLVLPSLRGEGMPMAVVEAMSHGVVPIVTSIASLKEIVADDETGLFVEPGSPLSIERAIVKLAGDLDHLNTMKQKAADFAREHFDTEAIAAKLLGIYAEMMDDAARP
ncbi:glycosyltransferase family 4 protein [Oryzibacter oryziterrae]|uniref:glycosyltransferase family 4 protein n=1 Tax=Oryzibacter oryziterrae TaxID=2766474 RepID=UPI001F1E4448|nr:glycosyltransferase family 4 protein [Oryzibacter oryziterrae]